MDDQGHLTFIEHLGELRSRLIVCFTSIFAASIIAYCFVDFLIAFLVRPARDLIPQFYFFSPSEAFLIQLKVALFCGLIASLPVLFYQIWRFVRPGLFQQERPKILVFSLTASLLFCVGAFFCYYLILPMCIVFLLSFQNDFLSPMIAFGQYISFATTMIFAFGATFLLPVVVYLLSALNIINAGALSVYRGYVLIAVAVIAAVLTPPDVISQILLGVPMYALFEVSIFVVRWTEKYRQR